MRVIFLHHAGGDKYSWRRYNDALPASIEKIYLELPGRGDRFSESLLDSTQYMIEDLLKQVLPYLNEPYILVGKSMGALHSYLLLHKIVQANLPLPIHVFLGSRKAPDAYRSHIKIAKLSSLEFWKGVEAYGGVPTALLQHKELMELYEPILRADFHSLESYEYKPAAQLPISATVMVGREDSIQLKEVLTWQNCFSKNVDFLELSGSHFFMHEQAYQISQMIEDKFSINGIGVEHLEKK
ncbi:MAG: alpha/beta fold hydrolase [Chitinophagales bacterium]|nr:alpha/beta fold hydrolase [Chitinophagales bacterium]